MIFYFILDLKSLKSSLELVLLSLYVLYTFSRIPVLVVLIVHISSFLSDYIYLTEEIC